jgi:hypothetical protein
MVAEALIDSSWKSRGNRFWVQAHVIALVDTLH